MKELTEKETERAKTLFELGWQKREIARIVLRSRVEGGEGEMLEALKEVIADKYKYVQERKRRVNGLKIR